MSELTASNDESVVFVDWTISLQEVRLQVDVEKVSKEMKSVSESSFKSSMLKMLLTQ